MARRASGPASLQPLAFAAKTLPPSRTGAYGGGGCYSVSSVHSPVPCMVPGRPFPWLQRHDHAVRRHLDGSGCRVRRTRSGMRVQVPSSLVCCRQPHPLHCAPQIHWPYETKSQVRSVLHGEHGKRVSRALFVAQGNSTNNVTVSTDPLCNMTSPAYSPTGCRCAPLRLAAFPQPLPLTLCARPVQPLDVARDAAPLEVRPARGSVGVSDYNISDLQVRCRCCCCDCSGCLRTACARMRSLSWRPLNFRPTPLQG